MNPPTKYGTTVLETEALLAAHAADRDYLDAVLCQLPLLNHIALRALAATIIQTSQTIVGDAAESPAAPFSDHAHGPTAIIRHLDTCIALAQAVQQGLRGHPFAWTTYEVDRYQRILTGMGITLITTSVLTLRGYRLKRGVHPVGTVQLETTTEPLIFPVYVVECQCVKLDEV